MALAIVNGRTEALIAESADADAGAKYPIVAQKDLVIRAQGKQYENTIATAAVNANGEADVNSAANNPAAAGTGAAGGPTTPEKTYDGGVLTTAETTNGSVKNVTVTRDAVNHPTYTLVIVPDADYKVSKVTYTLTTPASTPDGTPTVSQPVEVTFANGQYQFTVNQALAAPAAGSTYNGVKVTVQVAFIKILDPTLEFTATGSTPGTGGTGETVYQVNDGTFTVTKENTDATTGAVTNVNVTPGSAVKAGTKILVKVTPKAPTVTPGTNGGAATPKNPARL